MAVNTIDKLQFLSFILCKDCENRSSISGDIRLNTQFLIVLYKTFTNELCQLWSYWIECHEIFTRYRPTSIIYAVDAHIEVAISQLDNPISFLNARATNVGSLPFFHKIGCHGNVPCDIGNRSPDRSSALNMLSFGEKVAKISSADPEIIDLRAIIKK